MYFVQMQYLPFLPEAKVAILPIQFPGGKGERRQLDKKKKVKIKKLYNQNRRYKYRIL